MNLGFKGKRQKGMFLSTQGYSLEPGAGVFCLFCFNFFPFGVRLQGQRADVRKWGDTWDWNSWCEIQKELIKGKKKQMFVLKKRKGRDCLYQTGIKRKKCSLVFTTRKHRITLLTFLISNRFLWLCTFVCVCDHNIIKMYFAIFSSPSLPTYPFLLSNNFIFTNCYFTCICIFICVYNVHIIYS